MKRNKQNQQTNQRIKTKQELIAAILDARQLSNVSGGTESWPCGCGECGTSGDTGTGG